MAGTYKVHIDWDANGDFTGTYDDVTTRVLDDRTQVTCSYGRDANRALAPVKVGEAEFELNNISRDYSPENTSSALYDKAVPAREVRVQATLSGTTYTPFRGHIDDVDFKLDISERSVRVTCLDPMARLKGIQISTGMYRGVRTGDAIHLILDAIGWSPALRDIDPGATLIDYWWLDNADAYDAAMALVDSEGPAALLTSDDSGRVVFRDRHHRLLRTASQTVQSTWRASGVEPCFSAPATYSHGWKEIINSVSIEVPVRAQTPSLDLVWTSPGRVSLASGDTLNLTVKGNSPFVGAITPVSGTDYTVTGTVTVSMTRTDGESTTLVLTASSGAATLDGLQIRGYLLQTVATVVVTVEDGSSITKYGRRSGTNLRQPVWAGLGDAKAIAELIVGKRAERLAAISVTMGGNDTRLLQQLSRDLSDRVHVVEPHTGLDADCWIEQIAHRITQGGTEHKTTFGLEKVPTVVTTPFTFGVAGRGFNDGLFAQAGSDNPANMFLFDQASGHGFDQGVFCI
jgi:hypothetical protein